MKTKRFLGIIVITACLLIGFNVLIYEMTRKNTYNMLDKMVKALVEKYPDAEIDLFETLNSTDNSNKVLEKYGLNVDNVQELVSFRENSIKIIVITTIFYLGVIVTFGCYYFIYNLKIKKEINIINDYLKEILKGSYELNIASYNEDELSILKNDIYKVTIKLKELSLYEKQEQLFLMNTLEDISHQLKTPLTALMVTNDILKNNTLTKKERLEFLNKETKELEKMEWLITTLLKYSKLDSNMVILKKEEVKAQDLVDEAIKSLSIMLELKEVNVTTKNLDFLLTCDYNWTKEAFINILKNACEHIPKAGIITIIGEDNPLYRAISITDNGPGISKKEIKNIFKRFYSTSNSKNSMGIGLNMTKLILEKQNARIEVESELNKYTTFKIIFPKSSTKTYY